MLFPLPNGGQSAVWPKKSEKSFCPSDAGVFAAAYVVKKYPEFDPLTYIPHDGLGSKYNYSSFDPDGTWLRFLQARYHTETPRVCMRSLINYGLECISDIIEEHGIIRISDYI